MNTITDLFLCLLCAAGLGLSAAACTGGPVDEPAPSDRVQCVQSSDGEACLAAAEITETNARWCYPACEVLLGICDPEVPRDEKSLLGCVDDCKGGLFTPGELECLADTACDTTITCFDGE